MNRKQLLADLSLLWVVFIWGTTFVMVQDAVRAWPVFSFLALRFWIASLAFLPLLLWQRWRRQQGPARKLPLGPALLVGAMLTAGYAFQTWGLLFTTPAKAGIITGLSVVLVPIGAVLFLRQRVGWAAAMGVGLAAVGLVIITVNQDLSINLGDALVFCCAIAFAIHILLVGRFAPNHSIVQLAALQVLTAAVGTTFLALIFELPASLPPLSGRVLFAAGFTGLLATTVAFLAQTAAQRFTSATHTALIFSLEPVFAALASYLLIGEELTPRILLGGSLVLAGMLCAELGAAVPFARHWRRLRRQRRAVAAGS